MCDRYGNTLEDRLGSDKDNFKKHYQQQQSNGMKVRNKQLS